MLSQTFHYSVASVVSAVIGLLSAVVFTRLLSPEEYGDYVVGLSTAGIVSALLFTWIRVSALRFQSEGGAVDPVAGPKVSDLRTFAGFGIPIALSGIVFAIHAAHLAGAAPAVLALSDDQSARALVVAEQGRSTDIGGTHNR